ncbi:MAG: MFS transporter [Spirochaetia bacterium]
MHLLKGLVEKQHRSLYVGLFANCAVIGVGMTIVGATLPRMLAEFSWSYTAAGAVIAAGSLGDLASSFTCGVLLERIGPKAVMAGGLVLQTLALAFFAATPSVVLNFILSLLIGLGQGAIDVAVSYSVARIQKRGESHPMSIMHSAYAIGSVAGPVVIGLIIRSGLHWQAVYRGVAGITALMGVVMIALPFRRIAMARGDATPEVEPGGPARRPMFYLAAAILFLYVGLEFGSSRWIGAYFVNVLGSPASVGAFMVSVFWMGLLLGRLGIPVLFRKVDHGVLLLSLSLAATASVAFSILVRSPLVSGIGFFVAGLGCSAIFPLVMTIVGHYFRKGQGKAVGFAATGGAVGALVFPFAMASVSEAAGLRNGFWLYVVVGLAMSAVAAMTVPMVRRREGE